HINFPDSVSKRKVREIHAALPSWTLFRDPIKCLADKIKALIDERFRQKIARVLDRMKSQPDFPRLERLTSRKSGEAAYRFRVPDDEFWHVVQSGCLQQTRPS